MSCDYCLKRFHKKQENFSDLPRPAEILLYPTLKLGELWQAARIARERYQVELVEEIGKHDPVEMAEPEKELV